MIKFGTDGWRAIISDEFTFDNVRKVARAIAKYLLSDPKLTANGRPLIIGYDARFLADKFAEEMAKIMKEAGINVLLTEKDTPTPVIAWEVRQRKAAGAIVLTASHNPPEYCGIKFIPEYAGPANETITKQLQENSNLDISLPIPVQKGLIERFEPRDRYIYAIKAMIDKDAISRAKLKIVCDPMHGSGRGYLDKILQELGCQVDVIHGERDVLFGGQNPEPADEHLQELKKKVVESKSSIGLANDGDADRFGIVAENGDFYSANQIIPMLFHYLLVDKKAKGVVVRSIATSNFVDRIARHFKIKVVETPVGFKHIANVMMNEQVIIGGEESGGLSIHGHIPEKDGILADLLVVEMLAKRKKTLSQIWKELISEFGGIFGDRTNLKLDENTKTAFINKLKDANFNELAGIKIAERNTVDGVKLILDANSWVLARPSGTEPLVRIYAESDDAEKLKKIMMAVKALI
ncbi:MAG: phosphoglucomutase/phosphomannomutase family protein [Candidatus Margulisiibacteriota bacterium]